VQYVKQESFKKLRESKRPVAIEQVQANSRADVGSDVHGNRRGRKRKVRPKDGYQKTTNTSSTMTGVHASKWLARDKFGKFIRTPPPNGREREALRNHGQTSSTPSLTPLHSHSSPNTTSPSPKASPHTSKSPAQAISKKRTGSLELLQQVVVDTQNKHHNGPPHSTDTESTYSNHSTKHATPTVHHVKENNNIMSVGTAHSLSTSTSRNKRRRTVGSTESLSKQEKDITSETVTKLKFHPDEPRFCFCNQPEYGFMITCDGCDEWYHGSMYLLFSFSLSSIFLSL